MTVAAIGCVVSYPNAVRDGDGNEIRVDQITEILNDDTLTDDDKRQALRDLGIADESLIEYFLHQSQ